MIVSSTRRIFIAENNMEDFKMPYTQYGKTDREVTERKYQQLENYSINFIKRNTIIFFR